MDGIPFSTSLTGILTALGTCLTALALVINAYTARRRDKRIEQKVDDVQEINQKNHVMLNSEKKERMDYQRALIRFIEEKGMSVPVDQSIPDKVEPTDS